MAWRRTPRIGFGVGVFQQWRTIQELAEGRHRSHSQGKVTIGGRIDPVRSPEVGVGVALRTALGWLASIGDTITSHIEIVEKREHKRPSHGIVNERLTVKNQHGEVVLVCDHLLLVER